MPPHEQFLKSMYFIVITISTTGYGDLNPKNSNEIIFVNIVMVLGVLVFSFSTSALGNVNNLIRFL